MRVDTPWDVLVQVRQKRVGLGGVPWLKGGTRGSVLTEIRLFVERERMILMCMYVCDNDAVA